jgi:hypothetical protein
MFGKKRVENKLIFLQEIAVFILNPDKIFEIELIKPFNKGDKRKYIVTVI